MSVDEFEFFHSYVHTLAKSFEIIVFVDVAANVWIILYCFPKLLVWNLMRMRGDDQRIDFRI